jgi:aspartate aminotransferase
MSLSQLARSISESATLKLNATAARLREAGEPIIHLGGGEPKSKAPADAIANCTSLLQTGDVKYTPADGIAGLKKAIIRYTEEHYNRQAAPENVIVSGGAKQSIMVALHALLDPKDEVVFPVPYWVSYPEMVRIAGGEPIAVAAGAGGFEPTVEEMAAAMGPRTKAVIVNSPNNPSGAVYSEEFIAGMVKLCQQRGVYLIMDDTYNRLIFDGRPASNCYAYSSDPSLNDSKLVVINCVSKMYAMTGFRIGWTVASRELVRAMTNIQSQETSGPAAPSQWAAVGALNGDQSSIESLRATLEANRDVLVKRFAAFPGVKVAKPGGTFYSFPDFSAYEKDSQKLSAMLLDKVRVVTVPGREFGMEGHLRISFCGGVKDITEGIERIQWALDPNAPKELLMGDRKLVRD